MDEHEKEVIIEGVRFTPEMLADVEVDKEVLLNDLNNNLKTSNEKSHQKLKFFDKVLQTLIPIGGLIVFVSIYSLVDNPILKIGSAIGFVSLLMGSIHYLFKKVPDNKFENAELINELGIKYGSIALLAFMAAIVIILLWDTILTFLTWAFFILMVILYFKYK